MSAAPTREAVHEILVSAFTPAEELPRKRGVTAGFQVFGADAEGMSVAYYAGSAERRGIGGTPQNHLHAAYADLLATYYTVEWRIGSLRVTVKR